MSAALVALTAPHVTSFDYFVSEGLQRLAAALQPLQALHPGTGSSVQVWIESLRVGKPTHEESRAEAVRELRLFPRECRQAGTSYTAALIARVCWRAEDDGEVQEKELRLSNVPVMVRRLAASDLPCADARCPAGWLHRL